MRTLLGRASRSTALRLVVTAVILAYLSRRIDMAASARAMAAMSLPHLAVVLALVAVDRALMVLRWVLLLRASGVAVPAPEAARIFLVSSFVGSFLPAGGGGPAPPPTRRTPPPRARGGAGRAPVGARICLGRWFGGRFRPAGVGAPPARTYGLTPYTRGSEALASVAVDRLLGVFSLVAMSLAGLVAWAPAQGGDWRVAAAAGVLTAAGISVFWADRIVRWLLPTRHHEGPVARVLLRTSDAVSRYRNRRGALVHVMAWSILVQFLRITQTWILALGLGLTVPFAYLLLVMPVGLLMLLVPISVSGFGLPQGVMVWLLRPAGVPDPLSFALSTLIILLGLPANLPGLALWLSARKSSRI